MSLQALAEKKGLTVEKRQIPLTELAECDEAAECGTAAVISPISAVYDPDENKTYTFGDQVHPGKNCVDRYALGDVCMYEEHRLREPRRSFWISVGGRSFYDSPRRHGQTWWICGDIPARTLAAVLPMEMLSGSMLESLGVENMQ